MATAVVTDTVEAWQREVLAELRAIRVALERPQRPPSVLTRADRGMLERLLPTIAGALGSEPFASRDLAVDSAPGLRLALRDLSVKQIGKLLARAEGIQSRAGSWSGAASKSTSRSGAWSQRFLVVKKRE
jgi:hypothetical protein